MATRKGRCTNYDGCSKADKDEILEIDELDDFVCPECGRELEEIRTSKKKGINPIVWIIVGAILIIGVIAVLMFAFGNDKEDASPITPIENEASKDSIEIIEETVSNRNDTLVIKIEGQENIPQPEEAPAQEIIEEPTEEEKATEVAEAPAATPEAKPAPSSKSAPAAKPATPSSHKLSYGTWTGGLKNGKPHGTGTLTYSTSQTIDSRDSKGRIAQPGEYIVGEWDNGHLVQGRWFKKDGTKEAIIIGKAG